MTKRQKDKKAIGQKDKKAKKKTKRQRIKAKEKKGCPHNCANSFCQTKFDSDEIVKTIAQTAFLRLKEQFHQKMFCLR